jgi:hypothetical protein
MLTKSQFLFLALLLAAHASISLMSVAQEPPAARRERTIDEIKVEALRRAEVG